MEGTAQEQIEKLVINGQEYDPTEAQTLIDKGRMTSDYEQKWNTSLDKVWPEYTKSQQTLKQTQTELADARAQLEKFNTKQNAGTDTTTDLKDAREAARKLGITLNEDLDKVGYLKKDDLEKYLSERDSQRDEVNKIIAKADSLEKEIDGSDGRPKFNKKIVLAYANSYGVADLMKAYEEMHADFLKTWQAEKVAAKKQPGLKTFGASQGGKKPNETPTNDDNIKDRLREALWGSQQE